MSKTIKQGFASETARGTTLGPCIALVPDIHGQAPAAACGKPSKFMCMSRRAPGFNYAAVCNEHRCKCCAKIG